MNHLIGDAVEAVNAVDAQALAYAREVEETQPVLVVDQGSFAVRQAGVTQELLLLWAEAKTRPTGDLTNETYQDYTVRPVDERVQREHWLYESAVQPSFVTADRPFHYTLYAELAKRTGGFMLGQDFRLRHDFPEIQPQPGTISIFVPGDDREKARETIHATLMPRAVPRNEHVVTGPYRDSLTPVALNNAFDEPIDRRLPPPSLDLVGINSLFADDIPKLALRAKLTRVLREQRDPDAVLYEHDEALAWAKATLASGVKPLTFKDIQSYAKAQVRRAHRLTKASSKRLGWRK